MTGIPPDGAEPVGLVVVSHSRALAAAAVALAQEMLHGRPVRIEIAAGLDDGTFGTDAAQVLAAVQRADSGAGVVVLMDLGSAVLSTELAVELLDPSAAGRVLLCPAPLLEGLIVGAVAAAGGAGRAEVAAEAAGALAGKSAQLGGAPAGPPAELAVPAADEITGTLTVINPHGLHARPAARVVQAVRTFNAQVALRNRTTGSAWVPASSLSRVAVLGALRGHEIEVRVSGGQAREALDHLVALAARGFDDPEGPVADGIPVRAAGTAASGPLGACPGIGVGPARSWHVADLDAADQRSAAPEVEWRRLQEAVAAVRRTVAQVRARTVRDLGEGEAAIFDAHLLLLDDADLMADVRSRIDGGQAAAAAWAAGTGAVRAELAALPDPYLQARAADVAAVGDQVLRALLGRSGAAPAPVGVLVTGELTPADAANLDPARVTAVVQAFGSPTAHSAILLRAQGIPAVVAAGPDVLRIPDGTLLVVDGTRGLLVTDPDPEVLADFRERAADHARRERQALAEAAAPAVTRDGVGVQVGANLGSVQDARAAAAGGADLAGLVRTEFLFLGRAHAPDVDEQEAAYREIAAALDGRRITLRTLDVGGDKPLGYLPMPAEANPFLGVRGIRLSMTKPELLAEQLLAILRVAHDVPVSVMFPMVSTVDELIWARRMLDDAVKAVGGGEPTGLEVGMMVEVPAAALKARAFAPLVDFFSVGTNDLTQYALAAERGSEAVAAIGDPLDPGVLHLVDTVCRAGRPVAVCGELAADEPAAALLVGLGVRELSVSPRAIPAVKQAVRRLDGGESAALAADALDLASADAVRALLASRRP
jgi:phosphoenolpyruvate-protein phosphotransferase/dihydroxyacetone kinase phosphotransfer subunit